jgi:hypothetical protein
MLPWFKINSAFDVLSFYAARRQKAKQEAHD